MLLAAAGADEAVKQLPACSPERYAIGQMPNKAKTRGLGAYGFGLVGFAFLVYHSVVRIFSVGAMP